MCRFPVELHRRAKVWQAVWDGQLVHDGRVLVCALSRLQLPAPDYELLRHVSCCSIPRKDPDYQELAVVQTHFTNIYIYIYISYSTVEFYYANAMHEDTVWDLQDMKRFRSVSSRGCGLRPQMYVDGRPHNLYDVVCFTFYFTKKKVPRTCFKHKHSTWVFEMWIYGWHCALVGSF